MLAGDVVLEFIGRKYSCPTFFDAWLNGRYLLISAVLFVLLLGLYYAPKRSEDKYPVLPGAAFSSLATLLISPLFSKFIGHSVKYSLIYGSIASLVLLMLLIYMCCMIVYIGAAVNVALYNVKNAQAH